MMVHEWTEKMDETDDVVHMGDTPKILQVLFIWIVWFLQSLLK